MKSGGDTLSFAALAFAALLLALAPFQPEPHLFEKLRMLFQGTLTRPIDVFDLFMHGTPLVVVIVMVVRRLRSRGNEERAED